MLAIVRARGRADIIQLALELREVVLRKCDAQFEDLVGEGSRPERVAIGDGFARLVHRHAPRHRLAHGGGE